ncbi:MAG: hypothetical protein R3Y27_08420 [Clostridia bacterium]
MKNSRNAFKTIGLSFVKAAMVSSALNDSYRPADFSRYSDLSLDEISEAIKIR